MRSAVFKVVWPRRVSTISFGEYTRADPLFGIPRLFRQQDDDGKSRGWALDELSRIMILVWT
jgi:hypothetical protein